MIAPGTRIDRYEVLELLGSGGMGEVFRARHVGLGQDFALKLLRRERVHDADAVQRFLGEAKAAATIRSPHVVQVTDFGVSSEGQPFLVMERIDGPSLASHLARRGRLGCDDAVGIALDVLAGLQAAHELGIVHRDLKAENVLLAGDAVKIVDFGLAKVLTAAAPDTLTRTGTVLGTPYAMAPEQARSAKDVDARADLWSVGVLLYQALSGRPPFEGTSAEDLIVRICTEAPAPLAEVAPEVPAPLAAVVARALEREPAARFQSASEMSVALRQAVNAAATDAAVGPDGGVADVYVDDEDDEEAEASRAAARGPGPRPSLMFEELHPPRSWKLPLALGGFIVAAGGLIVLALVLRPTAPAPAPPAPVAAPPSVALPAYDEVAGVEVSLGGVRPSAPAVPTTTSAGPAKAVAVPSEVVHIRVLSAQGPLDAVAVEQRLAQLAPDLMTFRSEREVREQASGIIYPNGTLVLEEGAALFTTLRQNARFPQADTPTEVRLEIVLDAIRPAAR